VRSLGHAVRAVDEQRQRVQAIRLRTAIIHAAHPGPAAVVLHFPKFAFVFKTHV